MARHTTKRHLETKAALWMLRHPGFTATPAAIGTSVLQLGPVTTGSIAAGLLAGTVGWARTAPGSFHTHAAPRLRSVRRRWTRYLGPSWKDTLEACGLVTEDRRTGQPRVPRIVRVHAPTPSIDVVRVQIVKGQSLRTWQDHQDELASALGADVIGIEKVKPRVLSITLVHGNPFDDEVPPTEIPDDPGDVDLTALELGDTEYGKPWTEPLLGQHWLVSGATGSGKSSLLWNPLRAMGPMIRDQLVRVWVVDPKGGMETEQGKPLFHKHATNAPAASDDADDDFYDPKACPMLDLVEEFRDAMKARQELLRQRGQRKFAVAPDTPLEVLMIDELAMLTALGGNTRALNKLLAEILTQGRACGFAVCAYVQEPTKDIVPVRDLFTRRISLRTTSASYVDMVLGEEARLRGALADEIPETEDYAGIGYRVTEKSRNPIRVRAGHVTDADITELVTTCAPHQFTDDDAATGLVLVPSPSAERKLA